MKSKIVQLFVDVSTWSTITILRLGRIQVKREIIRIVTQIRVKVKKFRDQEQIDLLVGAHASRLMANGSRLMKI